MHYFKISLIVCVVYFITLAWSYGLNSDQLNRLNNLFNNHRTSTGGVSEKQIADVVKEIFGIEWEIILDEFSYKSNEPDSTNLYFLLTTLAQQDNKKSDDIEVKWLTPCEVDFFLEEFGTCTAYHDQPEYLTLRQLSETFEYWKTISVALDAKINKIKTENGGIALKPWGWFPVFNYKQEHHMVNAADFLLIMLEIKPNGRGLTLAQIGKFAHLYRTHKKASGGINHFAIIKVFEELGITINYDLQKLFKSNRSPGNLLIELILVAAERNQKVDEKSPVLSLCEVVSAIGQFIDLDVIKDGVLKPDEYANFVKNAKECLEGSAQLYLGKFDGIHNIHIAEYMQAVSFIAKHTGHCPFAARQKLQRR